MLRSLGLRFFIVGLLILLMFIPVLFVGDIIDARADYNRATRTDVGREWGGRQALSGPVLVIPVQETVVVREKREVLDPETGIQRLDADDKPVYRFVDVQRVLRRDPVYLYPDQFNARIDTETQERHRGIFNVPVYQARADLAFDFPIEDTAQVLNGEEVLLWDEAELQLSVSTNRGLRGDAALRTGDGTTLQMEPLALQEHRVGGLRAPTGDPRGHGMYALTLAFNGAESLSVAPVGRDNRVEFTSDWAHPSFSGAFLPDGHDISEKGFIARWTIPHLARPLPQVARENQDHTARTSTAFGVELYQPNDFYQKSYRAARYGILFIGLTFLTIFLIEGQSQRPTHPVQYILVGLVQSTFFLLMLALAEQMGFATAYLIAAMATVALITAFAAMALKLGRRSLVLGLLLALLYGVLYLILRSADYALLAGSALTFAAISGTMYATRNENWYGEPSDKSPRRGWFGRGKSPEATVQAQPRAPTSPPAG